jgi:alkylhydroperoxidase/carboxymuconolactone decarboxylase family protein YurZ
LCFLELNKDRKEKNMAIPKRFQKFARDYPDVAGAYETLGDAVHAAGPLDKKTRALIKLSISIGARLDGAVHAHVRKALHAGVKPDELRHAALLSLPTIGLPSMMAALSWIDDVVREAKTKRGKK